MTATALNRPQGPLDVRTALQPYAGPWDMRRAAHLLRRAGFGGTPADVERLARMSVHAAVDSLVHFPPDLGQSDAPAEIPGLMQEYQRLFRALNAGEMTPQAVLQMLGEDLQPGQTMQMQQMPGGQPAQAAAEDVTIGRARGQLAKHFLLPAVMAAQRWWLGRMLHSSAPLQEKMVLFWHGHFTSEVQNKGVSPPMVVTQNQLFRRYALGNVHELTQAVARDPAMLRYLDNAQNVKAHPNENFARELMELFTLGIGNYTEQDVRESARAFTGWTVRRDAFFANVAQHDDGRKAFLGRSGNFDGGDIIDVIFQQPAAPRWFAKKLLDFFLYNDPEPQLIDATASLIRKNNFNLLPVMSTLLRSNVFYSNRAYRALVKSPVEFIIGSFQLYGVADVAPQVLGDSQRMGQILFKPPNVKGWEGGMSWLNSQTLLTRENFASALVASQLMPADSWLTSGMPASAHDAAERLVGTILQGDASPASVARLVGYLNGDETTVNGSFSGENFPERIRGAAYLTMAMPAYQLA